MTIRPSTLLLGLIIAAVLLMAATGLLFWKRLPDSAAAEAESRRARAAELVQRAVTASESGRAAAARSYYQQALQLDPENQQALLHTASALQQDGQLQQAAELLTRITTAPDTLLAKVRFLQATIALQEHRAVAAEQLFLEAAALETDWPPPLRDLLPLYAVQQRSDQLLQTLARIESLRPLTPLELAMRLLSGTALVPEDMASVQLQNYLTANPADASSLRAVLLMRAMNNPSNALQLLNERSSAEAVSPALQELRLYLQSQSGTQEFTSPYLDQFTLQTDSSVEAFQAALSHPLVSSVPEFRIALSRALRQRQPWSPTASHELAEALNAAGRTADATRQHAITRNLDQLELLAWRVFRPQAAIPEMALPLYLEISSRLQEMGAVDEAGKWLTATESLTPVPAVAMTEIAARRRTLEQALAARATDQSSQDTETTAALLAKLPPIPVRRIPLSTPVPGGPSDSPAVYSPDTDWQFVDVAAELGLNFTYYNGQSEFRSIVETIGGGSAVVDFDGDDWPDVFLPQVQPGTDRLFRNLRGTRFEDSSTVSAVDGVGHGLAATAGDFDCDGFVDLCVTRLGSCRLLKNHGDGSFSDVTPSSLATRRGCSSGACFADLNQDGLPELFVLNYVEDWEHRCVNSEGRYAVCDPRELRPAVNRLYRNLGDGEFEDITESSGLSAFPGRALGVIAADLTCDGRLDVFVANDGLPNSLLTFDATTFQLQNIAFVAGVAVPENGRAHAGMGAALADFNADALPDLLVTNFYREVNTLYQSIDCGQFIDASQRSGAGPPSLLLLGFGVQPLDVEQDGFMDAVILNGDIDDYSASGRPWKMPVSGLRGMSGGEFVDMAGRCGRDFEQPQLGRGLSRLDFDGDGSVDLAGVRHDGPLKLFRNQTPQKNPAVRLRLIGTGDHRSALGTAVDSIDVSGRRQRFWLTAGDGFAASNEAVLSLPAAAGEVSVEISGVNAHRERLSTGSWACRLQGSSPPLFFKLPK